MDTKSMISWTDQNSNLFLKWIAMTQKGKKLSYRDFLDFLINEHSMYIYHNVSIRNYNDPDQTTWMTPGNKLSYID